MDELIHLSVDTKIEQATSQVFPEMNQQIIDSLCREINSITDYFRSVLNENTLYVSDEWTGERFKQDFLMTSVHAVRQGRQSEIWPNLKKTSGDLIIDCLMDMIESAKTSMSPDEVVSKGLVPKVIGVDAATEILHKFYPTKFATRNERLEAGLAYFLFDGDKNRVKSLTYEEYIKYMKDLAEKLNEHYSARDLSISETCKLFLLEKLLGRVVDVSSDQE